jgi:uncharacterized protein with GYD domain
MPKYLFVANYTATGEKGVLAKGGSDRRTAVTKMVTELGGKLESFYFAFGNDDAYVIVDLPDNETAAAASLTVAESGAATLKTIVLITPEQIDAAVKKHVDYRKPGA